MKCLICDKVFKDAVNLQKHLRYTHKITSVDYYNQYIKKDTEGFCEICGKSTNYINMTKGYRDFCSVKCMRASRRVTEKRIFTNIERFGVENASQNLEIKNKKKETTRKNYGVDHHLQSKEVKNGIRKKNLEKYNVGWASQREDVKKKVRKTVDERYGGKYPFNNEEVKQKNPFKNKEFQEYLQSFEIQQKRRETHLINYWEKMKPLLKYLNLELLTVGLAGDFLEFKCTICNQQFKSKGVYLSQGYGRCSKCFGQSKSVGETEVYNYIRYFFKDAQRNVRSLIRGELDIFIPSKKFAIEYNGLYYHSELHGKDKYYHLQKLEQCTEKGIRLIQIFEDEWAFKPLVVQSFLIHILGQSQSKKIYARSCIIKIITIEANKFLDENHLQGKDNSIVRLGAFYNDELVAVMTFSHGNVSKGMRVNKPTVWELNRFCCKYDYHIPGIASKLLTCFKRNYEWSEIFSYADRRWSQGNVYHKLGFKHSRTTEPNYWYAKTMKRIHRFNLRKRPDEPKDIPEWILRSREGYFKIWDCGHLKFVMRNENYM